MKLFSFSTPRCRVAVLGTLLSAVCCTAFAHAHLMSSEPAANAQGAAPTQLALHFTEPLEPAFSKVVIDGADGKAAASAASTVDAKDAKTMRLALPALAAGRYTVHWTAVATDGHRTQGDYTFTVQ